MKSAYNVFYTGVENGNNTVKVRMFVMASSKAEAHALFQQELIDAGKWINHTIVKVEPHEESI